jgi:hypothetical protein
MIRGAQWEVAMSELKQGEPVGNLGGKGRRAGRLLGLAALAAVGLLLLQSSAGRSQKDPAAGGGGAKEVPLDNKSLATTYSNFVRFSVNPEELILDFGLNPNMGPNPKEPVKMTARVVMSYYNAKRLMLALQRVVQEHEKTYGELELDFRKRARPGKGGGKAG